MRDIPTSVHIIPGIEQHPDLSVRVAQVGHPDQWIVSLTTQKGDEDVTTHVRFGDLAEALGIL